MSAGSLAEHSGRLARLPSAQVLPGGGMGPLRCGVGVGNAGLQGAGERWGECACGCLDG